MNEQEVDAKQTIKTSLLTFAYELGTWIVLPLLICVVAGVWFDRRFDTKPLGVIAGLLFSLIPTTLAIAKKIKKFNP